MAKRMLVIAAVITVGFVIAIFAGSGEDTGIDVRSPKLESSLAVPQMLNYQGVLTDGGGSLLDTTVTMTFAIYDAASGGTQLWTETQGSVTSFNGLYNVLLGSVNPIPSAVFEGQNRWLGVAVGGDPEMTPRRRIASSGYAYYADMLDGQDASDFAAATHEHDADYINDGAGEINTASDFNFSTATFINNLDADLLDGQHASDFLTTGNDYGRSGVAADLYEGTSTLTDKYVNEAGPEMMTGSSSSPILTVMNSGNGHGLSGSSISGHGVYGLSMGGKGVYGENYGTGNYGWLGGSDHGVLGAHASSGNYGWVGDRDNVVYGNSGTAGNAVRGSNSSSGVGVSGYSSSGYGVRGSTGSGKAGYFLGDVQVTGNLSKGGGSFKIDHPLDPENKYLSHSFVESPDMMNIYNGNVVLDENGEAWVELPEWFEALNKDFRYQLTCIGGFAPVYVAEKISGNRFKIAGGNPGMEVSWQVTGIRHDRYAEVHRIPVEEEKPAVERGYYLHPDVYGLPEERNVEWARHPELMRLEKEELKSSLQK